MIISHLEEGFHDDILNDILKLLIVSYVAKCFMGLGGGGGGARSDEGGASCTNVTLSPHSVTNCPNRLWEPCYNLPLRVLYA